MFVNSISTFGFAFVYDNFCFVTGLLNFLRLYNAIRVTFTKANYINNLSMHT